jgi:hypothetical protein
VGALCHDRRRVVSRIVGEAGTGEEGRVGARLTWIAVAVAAIAVIALLAITAGLWSSIGDVDMSAGGWIALVLGVLFAVALGVGLMALVFISNRRGYDELDGDRR